MPHCNRYYPRHIRQDIALLGIVGWNPPRKMKWKATTTASQGTLAAPWLGTEIISDIGDNETDPDKIFYTFNHPTVSDNFIKLIWSLKPQTGTNPHLVRPNVSIVCEFWYHGTKYGDFESRFNSEWCLLPGLLSMQWDLWTHLIDTTKFRRIDESRIYASSWAEQPEYHPYRADP